MVKKYIYFYIKYPSMVITYVLVSDNNISKIVWWQKEDRHRLQESRFKGVNNFDTMRLNTKLSSVASHRNRLQI